MMRTPPFILDTASCVDDVGGGLVEVQVQGDIVGLTVRCHPGRSHARCGVFRDRACVNGQIRVVAQHVHAQLDGGIGHLGADGTQTDDAQGLAHDLRADELAALPFSTSLVTSHRRPPRVPRRTHSMPPEHVTGGQQQVQQMTSSLTALALAPGVLNTTMPRFGALVDGNVVGAGSRRGRWPAGSCRECQSSCRSAERTRSSRHSGSPPVSVTLNTGSGSRLTAGPAGADLIQGLNAYTYYRDLPYLKCSPDRTSE